MALLTTPMLAQDDFEPGKLLYLLVFFVLPLLSKLGAKLRQKFEKHQDDGTRVGKRVEPPRPAEPVERPTWRRRALQDCRVAARAAESDVEIAHSEDR